MTALVLQKMKLLYKGISGIGLHGITTKLAVKISANRCSSY